MKQVRIKKQPWARGKHRPKLDLRLATLLELGPTVFAEHMDHLEKAKNKVNRTGPLAFLGGRFAETRLEAASAPPFVSVFLTATSPEALERLEQGFEKLRVRKDKFRTRLISKAGNIATAEIGLDDLKKIEDDPDVVAIEWTGAIRPAGEEVAGPAKVLSPRESIGLDKAPADLDGRGTVIGIIDVEGLDLYHPSFTSELGRPRASAIWDQRARPRSNDDASQDARKVPYGRAYDRDTIDREISPKTGLAGGVVSWEVWKGSHGTKTAGLAAGLGWDRPEAKGIAPEAELVFVNTFGSGVGALGAMTEIADALAFVFKVADEGGKPCVVSLSMGDDLGPRDATSPVERFIDQLLETPGRAVVIAAGNSADNGRRTRVELGEGSAASFVMDVGEGNFDRAVLEIWYRVPEGSSGAVELEIEAPGDGGRTGRIPSDGVPRAYDAESRPMRLLVAGSSEVPGGAGARNGLLRIEMLSTEKDTPLLAGNWQFHLHSKGGVTEAHAWLDHKFAKLSGGDQAKKTSLTTPATSRKAITVGAWNPARQKVYFFSGRGPCRDGRPKPDLVAPGGPLWTASAITAVRHVPTSGTSMAAPLVAGAIALLFQREKDRRLASADVVRGLFPAGAEPRGGELGFGVLDLAHWFAEGAAGAAP